MVKKRKQLTHEQTRIASVEFLWDSKVPMRHSLFMILEYIQNYNSELNDTKSTTNILGKSGNSFFIAHI